MLQLEKSLFGSSEHAGFILLFSPKQHRRTLDMFKIKHKDELLFCLPQKKISVLSVSLDRQFPTKTATHSYNMATSKIDK